MSVFVAEHTHSGATCPAGNPEMAKGLLAIVSPDNARRRGITIRGEAVLNGQHHLYLIVEASDEKAVRDYFAPFGQFGSLTVSSASPCEDVVRRGVC